MLEEIRKNYAFKAPTDPDVITGTKPRNTVTPSEITELIVDLRAIVDAEQA